MEEDFAAWKAKFWAATVERFDLDPPKETGQVRCVLYHICVCVCVCVGA
jgi:hypothetical protein